MSTSAVLRAGTGTPVPLHGTPAVAPGCRPGEITIILGWTRDGQAVTLDITTLEWAGDLEDTARVAWAAGIARAGMRTKVAS